MSTFRTTLPDARRTPRYAGIPTFCRFPRLDDVPADQRPVDWALYGVPTDSGVTYRPGARFGPRAVRAESQYVKPYHLAHDVNIARVLSLADAGDAPVSPFDLEASARGAAAFAMTLGDPERTKLLAVGGDHSIALANLRATHARRGGRPLALIHFDAHLDTVPDLGGERFSHASPFIRAVEENLIDPKRMLSIGIRGPLNTKDDLDFARRQGVTLVTCDRWRAEGAAPIDAFLSTLGGAETYLTFDIDCVDPAFAPGTGTPSVGGFTSAEVLALLRHLSKHKANLVGADVVEVLPDRDTAGITALLAAHVIFEILALDALRRR